VSYESTLQAAFLIAVPKVFPNLRLFRRNVGVAKVRGATIRYSIPGQCDLYGYIRGAQSRVVEIELKSATGTLEPEQKMWRDFCLAWGVPWICLKAKKDETADETVSRWCDELKVMIG
jgi:hypothetical protein